MMSQRHMKMHYIVQIKNYLKFIIDFQRIIHLKEVQSMQLNK